MTSTMDGNKLQRITVTGKGLSAQMRDACTKASLSIACDQVTQMSLTFEDSHDLDIFRSGVLARGASINYGGWYLTSEGESLDAGSIGPQITIKAPSRFVTALRKQKGAYSWGNVDLSGWVASVAKSVGMSSIVQPGLGRKTIVRKKGEDGNEPESTWDVLTQMSREVGVWLFEYGSTLVFGKPSWLVSTKWKHREWPIVWNHWANYSSGLAGMPKYEDDPTRELAESLTLKLISTDADSIRPGDTVRLSGAAVGKMSGVWIVRSVDFPLSVAGVVTASCQRPVDPKVEPPRVDTPAKSTTTKSASTSSRGPIVASGIAAAVDRWAASVNQRGIDTDGAFGAQCVDLANHYHLNVVGARSQVIANGNQWFANAPSSLYEKFAVGGANGEAGQKGDIACWGGYYGGGYGHVAIVLADRGANLLVMSQNPGPARAMVLSKSGLTGYLRPKRVG
ncbi:minor tail protein [Arthrobacter phage EastWest]|uniref:Minor tail protein n=1 Tax=Arthrobacter phage EastWest TaxID=2894292 RepID=A0AAE9C8T1_9CAUD|nr:minor tail protein [Arthrobacter phage EastWest]